VHTDTLFEAGELTTTLLFVIDGADR